MPDSTIRSGSIAFLGFGEAAHAFLDGWRANSDFKARICAYDIKTDSPDSEVRTAKRADYAAAKVLGASTAAEAVTGAEAVFSVVTADQAHEAAIAALPGLAKGALFFSTAIPARRRPRRALPKRSRPRADVISTSR